MIRIYSSIKEITFFTTLIALFVVSIQTGCRQKEIDLRIRQIEPGHAASMASRVDSAFKADLPDSNLSLTLWGIDSLVISPIAIDIDDYGSLYYVTTNRQKNSEFDIRGHQDWEIPSIQLQSIEDKRAFLHRELSPENSERNKWLKDLNGDGSHDWRDMTIEKEHVYRLTDRNGDGVADQSQLIVEDFNDEVTDVVGGVLKTDNDMFVAVGPDLWRMKDKNGDGIADDKTSISHGYGIHIGFSGHGMSGVEMGPDGRIYWQIGDIGFNGVDQTGKKWEYPNCGVIARSNPDGSDFEIFASGLRNTHEFVFDEYGNLISEDNDGDHAGEQERLVYIVNGSDAGWRSNWQYGKYRDPDNNTYKVWMDEKMWMPRFEGQAAYIVPPIANYVSGPAGMVYNPGTALSPSYLNTFFIAKFVGTPSQSGVYGFKLKPNGAGFELGESKLIVGGVLPTGLDFGPDGALYIADWIDGWGTHDYGRIWKLDDRRGQNLNEREQTKALLAADLKQKSSHYLEALLKSPDMRVRLKAQFEIATRGNEGVQIFKNTLSQGAHQLSRVHAVWGLSQMARKEKKIAENLIPYLKDQDPEIRAQVAKWLGDIKYKESAQRLLPLLKDEYARARFFAAEALGRFEHEPAISNLIELLRDNNDKDVYIRHAASLALARIGKTEPLVQLAKDSSRAVRIASVVALRRMAHLGIAEFLNDRDEFVVTETARAINDDLSIKGALPALGNLLMTTSFKNEALIRRCINANLRVGTDQALNSLLDYSRNENAPVTMRTEALHVISTWAKPSVVDRVDGRYRGEMVRDENKLRNEAGTTITDLLNNKNAAIRLSAVKAVGKIKISDASTTLMTLLKNDNDAAVRKEALKTLASLNDSRMDEAIRLAVTDKDKSVRVAGIDLITKLAIPKELMVSLLSDVINTKTVEEKQAALLALGKTPSRYSEKTFEGLLQQMAEGRLSPAMYLELAEAIDSAGSAALSTKYQTISKGLSPDSLVSAYAGSLTGGDVQRGERIFYSNQSAQCIRCHSYHDAGGNAGPRLDGVASRLTRSQILESLINPGARLAPGFGMVTLELKNGNKVTGILNNETNQSITVRVGDKEDVIQKSQVLKRTNAASSMPDMKAILSKKQIRDLVSFLSEMK